jgi:hypothetical protein
MEFTTGTFNGLGGFAKLEAQEVQAGLQASGIFSCDGRPHRTGEFSDSVN